MARKTVTVNLIKKQNNEEMAFTFPTGITHGSKS